MNLPAPLSGLYILYIKEFYGGIMWIVHTVPKLYIYLLWKKIQSTQVLPTPSFLNQVISTVQMLNF